MANISQIKINNTAYDIKDDAARTNIGSWNSTQQGGTITEVITNIKSEIKGGTHLLGKVMSTISEEIYDGSHYNGPIYIEGTQTGVTAKAGDIVLNGAREFIWDGVTGSEEGTSYYGTWRDLGNETGLGALAYKDYIGVEDPSSGQIGDVVTDIDAGRSGDISIKNWEVGSVKVGRTFSAGSLPSMSVNGEVLTFDAGSLPSLSDGTTKRVPVVPADDDIQMTVTLGRYTAAAPPNGSTVNYLTPSSTSGAIITKKKLVAKNNS